MRQVILKLRLIAAIASLIVGVSTQTWSQEQASGGRITPESPPATKTAAKPNARDSARKPARKISPIKNGSSQTSGPVSSVKSSSRLPAAAFDSIAGKWWTTGNGFGDSEVVLTQSGPHVSGSITYADGRTGTLTGTLVGKRLEHSWSNSSGDGGTGWLELSWNNFLGGRWHNQRVSNGSWTLSRIEGKWCFGGNRGRVRTVTHNARGQVLVITEDGSEDEGRLEGPLFFLDSDFGSIEGTMNFKNNRVDWSTGFYWTWCGP